MVLGAGGGHSGGVATHPSRVARQPRRATRALLAGLTTLTVVRDAPWIVDRSEVVSAARHSRRSLTWPISLGALVFAGVATTTSRLLTTDTFSSLSAGRLISQHGVPRTETMTWAAHGKPWVDQQWLAQWFYYQAYRLGGYPAVGGLSALCVAVAFGLLAGYMLHRGISPVRVLIWTVIGYGACELNTFARTQTFAYPLFVLVLVLILNDDRTRRFSRPLVALPLVFLLWANLHGSVLLAAPIVVAYCLWAAAHNLRTGRRRITIAYLLLAGSVPAAILTTPYGFTIVDYYRSVLANPVLTAHVGEWQPATFSGVSIPFVILLLATLAAIGFAHGRGYRPPLFMVAITCALAAAGAHAVRHQVWFAFVATILIADVMHRTSAAGDSPFLRTIASRAIPALAVIGAAVAIAVLLTTPRSRFEQLAPPGPMLAAASYAQAHPNEKMLAADFSSSALIWTDPKLQGRVGFDARYEIYPHDQLAAYADWEAGAGQQRQWSRVLKGYDIAVTSAPLNKSVINRMRALTGWHQIYTDADGAVFVRNSA
jgi:hypothetical protein